MLPKIPYSMEKNKSMTVPIGNLNFSSNFKPGDIAESYGISARKYPRLTNRKTEEKVLEGVSGEILGMTVFNGEIVTVRTDPMPANTSAIYVGDQRVHDLQGQQKRKLTAINTKLVIYPDKIYIEKVGDKWISKPLRAIVGKEANVDLYTKFTPNSLTISSWIESYEGYGIKANISESIENPGFRSFSGNFASGTSIDMECLVHKNGYIIAGVTQVSDDKISVSYNQAEKRYSLSLGECSTETIGVLDKARSILCVNDAGLFKFNSFDVRSDSIYDDPTSPDYYESYSISGTVSTDCDTDMPVGNYSIYAVLHSDSSVFANVQEGRYVSLSPGDSPIISGFVKKSTWYLVYLEDVVFDNIEAYNTFYFPTFSQYGWIKYHIEKLSRGDHIFIKNQDNPSVEHGPFSVSAIEISTDEDKFTIKFDGSSEFDFSMAENNKVSITNYVSGDNFFSEFKKNDGVTVSGSLVEIQTDDKTENVSNDKSFVISKIKGNTLYASSDIFVEGESTTPVTIERRVPDLDFICEKDNRLYGVNNTEKTIYVSALGDPTNMYAYEGVSTDSFAVAVGGEGDFTGCCKYGESVLFFKEDKIYKLVGSYPAEFALYSYDVDGLQDGADKSPVVINEVLYYKGRNGIFAYTGGVPTLISENFGERVFKNAVAGTDGVSYYVSMEDADVDDKIHLLSYNTRLGIWVLEDISSNTKVGFVRTQNGLHYADEEGNVYFMNASDDVSEREWMVQFVPFYETIEGKKTYSRLLMRVEIPRGSYMIIEVRSDGGAWREAGKIVGAHNRVIPIRLPIARCDKFEIRLRGKGEFSILDILREYHVGSEV